MKKVLIILITLSQVLMADVVVIANKNVPKIDSKTVGKIFTGKVIRIENVNVTPINLKDSKIKSSFLQKFTGLNEEQYIAYWTVRQYIGKGVPPKELNSVHEVISYIQNNDGAIGYIDKDDLKNDLNVID